MALLGSVSGPATTRKHDGTAAVDAPARRRHQYRAIHPDGARADGAAGLASMV